MAQGDQQASGMARAGRQVAIVIVATVVLWLVAQWGIVRLGLGTRVALLADLAAGGAFVWALVVTFGLWRRQQAARKEG